MRCRRACGAASTACGPWWWPRWRSCPSLPLLGSLEGRRPGARGSSARPRAMAAKADAEIGGALLVQHCDLCVQVAVNLGTKGPEGMIEAIHWGREALRYAAQTAVSVLFPFGTHAVVERVVEGLGGDMPRQEPWPAATAFLERDTVTAVSSRWTGSCASGSRCRWACRRQELEDRARATCPAWREPFNRREVVREVVVLIAGEMPGVGVVRARRRAPVRPPSRSRRGARGLLVASGHGSALPWVRRSGRA